MLKSMSIFLLLTLVGCNGASTSISVASGDSIINQIADKLPTDQRDFFTKSMPDVLRVCEGVAAHVHELTFVGVELGNYRPSIVWHVPDTGTTIPATWMAGGNSCYFEYDAKQDAIMIAKEGCKNLCAGKADAANDTEFLMILMTR